MRFLLDTNVVSELRKGARADPRVRDWLASVDGEDLGLSVLVLAEIRLGVLRLRRRDPDAAGHLFAWLTRLERSYEGRTLPVDGHVARIWSELNAERPQPVIDSLLAATALAHGLTLVTRNSADLAGVDIPLLDPFGE